MTGNVQNEAKFVLKFLEVFFENLQKVPEGYLFPASFCTFGVEGAGQVPEATTSVYGLIFHTKRSHYIHHLATTMSCIHFSDACGSKTGSLIYGFCIAAGILVSA